MKKILVIDDSAEVLSALVLSLEHAGYSVTGAQRIQEAKSLLFAGSFDLVICDLIMPEMSGIMFQTDMAERIPLPPFLFCSGIATAPFSQPFPKGVAGFQSKPFPISVLTKKIESIFDPHSI